MAPVLVLLAHPDLARSRVNRALAAAAARLPAHDVQVRDLYALYPDYVIDVQAEQQALGPARTLVWLHPIQWYAMPPLLKLWLDEVFTFGWAYGHGGRALAGKALWLAVSTGGSAASYAEGGAAGRPVEQFLAPCEQTARLVGMRYLPPLVFPGAHRADDAAVQAHARAFAARLAELAAEATSAAPAEAGLPAVADDERPH